MAMGRHPADELITHGHALPGASPARSVAVSEQPALRSALQAYRRHPVPEKRQTEDVEVPVFLVVCIILVVSAVVMAVAAAAGLHQLVQPVATAGAGLTVLVIAAAPSERRHARR